MSEAKIICGDCVVAMRELNNACIDIVVTSPPYDNLRTYDGYTWCFKATANRLTEVLKPGGAICWIVGDGTVNGSESLTSFKHAIYFREQCGLRLHDTMIYHKRNFSAPNRARYHQCFEYVFVLAKGALNPICDKLNLWPITSGDYRATFGKGGKRERDGSFSGDMSGKLNRDMGMRDNVWTGNTRAQEEPCAKLDHHAQMPQWLARDLIRSFSNPGDIVLDPMAGSGTVGEQAGLIGRDSILIDISAKSCRLMRRNLKAWQIDGKPVIKVLENNQHSRSDPGNRRTRFKRQSNR
jgi:site-specific DNA-methyltransferase (adenine-specific)